jgi:NAD(P)-dependent dehydrogenase (short-subunit alcohol dehydrogenase family)
MKGTLVITGGSHGIGRATAETFLQDGWRVVSLSRTQCDNRSVRTILVDLSDQNLPSGGWREELKQQCDGSSRVCVVHNAGQFVRDDVDKVDLEFLHRAFRLMVVAPCVVNEILLPMLGDRSSLIYVGSTLGELGVPHAFSYISIKHAVIGMMRATQQDLSGRGVHTCCVCPGVTATRMVTGDAARPDDFAQTRVSMRRLLQPGEVADVIRFAADNPSINGAVIHANLGQENS